MELRFYSLYTLTWVAKILMRAISNVHAGRRFPTIGVGEPSYSIIQLIKPTSGPDNFVLINGGLNKRGLLYLD